MDCQPARLSLSLCMATVSLPTPQRFEEADYILDSLVWFHKREIFQGTSLYPGRLTRMWDNARLFQNKCALYLPLQVTTGCWVYLCLLSFLWYSPCSPPWPLLFINAISWWKFENNVAEVDCWGTQLPLLFSSSRHINKTPVRFFILYNQRERCICRDIDKMSDMYYKVIIIILKILCSLNLYTLNIYIKCPFYLNTQQYILKHCLWIFLKKPILFIRMGYFRMFIFFTGFGNFIGIFKDDSCSWTSFMYWKLSLKLDLEMSFS